MIVSASKGLLVVRKGGKLDASIAVIGQGGRVPRTMERDLKRMLGEIGYPALQAAMRSHPGHALFVHGGSFVLPKSPDRLLALIEKHRLPVTPEQYLRAFGAWKGRRERRTSRRAKK